MDKRSPPTSYRPEFDFCTRRLMRVEFVVASRLASRVIQRVLRFSALHKNRHFKIPIRSGRQSLQSSRLKGLPCLNIIGYYYLYTPAGGTLANKLFTDVIDNLNSNFVLWQIQLVTSVAGKDRISTPLR